MNILTEPIELLDLWTIHWELLELMNNENLLSWALVSYCTNWMWTVRHGLLNCTRTVEHGNTLWLTVIREICTTMIYTALLRIDGHYWMNGPLNSNYTRELFVCGTAEIENPYWFVKMNFCLRNCERMPTWKLILISHLYVYSHACNTAKIERNGLWIMDLLKSTVDADYMYDTVKTSC